MLPGSRMVLYSGPGRKKTPFMRHDALDLFPHPWLRAQNNAEIVAGPLGQPVIFPGESESCRWSAARRCDVLASGME